MRVCLQVNRRSGRDLSIYYQRRGIENPYSCRFQACFEFRKGWIVQRPIFRRARRKHSAFDDRFYRDRHNNEIDSSGGQLIVKVDDRRDWVGLNSGGLSPPLHSKGIQKSRPDDMIDIGSIKEPTIAAGVN